MLNDGDIERCIRLEIGILWSKRVNQAALAVL
jgi:hypothetical protein